MSTSARAWTADYYHTAEGLDLYYEIHGEGEALVLLHGGGSTIASNFERILPQLAKTHKAIAIELQAHGHTRDTDRPLSFEQDADDVAALLRHLGVTKADFLGFSNGGTSCLQIAIRHPDLVNKLVLCSASYRRNGMMAGFFDGMQQARLEHMPGPLQEAYRVINSDLQGLQAMFERDVARMLAFKDITDEEMRTIAAPALVINGDSEVILAEHALQLSQVLPNARLAILPSGHGDYIGELCAPNKSSRLPDLVVAMVEEFLAG